MGLASHPAAEESDRTGKAPHARSDDVQDLAGRGLRAQKKNDRFNNIIEPNELQKSGLFHNRLDRQRSEPPHQRTATKGCAPDNHGRAQDDPIESAGFQRRFTSMFAGRERCCFAIYANGREVNEPSDAHFLAGGNQGGHAFVMNDCC